jgi:tRNA U34 5-carboxymethylaminomethyl modifying GTPase MnmE/TrmE
MTPALSPEDAVRRIDMLLSHVWMVRTFLKHSDEAVEDEEIQGVHRELYDYMLALGGKLAADDADAYLKQARKKLSKLERACELFLEIQPEVSGHMNFQMAAQSLSSAVREIGEILGSLHSTKPDPNA